MSDYLLPFLLVFRPRRTAIRIPHVVAWWRPYLMVALCAVALALMSHTMAVSLVLSRLPSSATPADLNEVRSWLDDGLLSRTLLLPLRVALESSITALLLLAFARAVTGQKSGYYRGFLILSLSTSLIPLLARYGGMLRAHIAGNAPSLVLRPWLSAADLLPAATDYRVTLLLTSINLFTLWYVGSVTLGLAVLCRCNTWKAFLVAVATWTVSTAFSTTAILLLRNAFQFRL